MHTNELGSDTIKQSVKDLRDQGNQTAHVIKDRAVEVADEVKQQANALVSRSMDFIQARPFASLGIAVALGYMSRTIFRIGLLAGAAMVIAKVAPMVSGRARV
jgi:ElaB/YqjD/DUF883 family membrane-anchored ribosome-binding protein